MKIKLIAALGSSFAAGPGIAPFENAAAGRSRRNYAHQLAERIGAELVDLSVSGATTSNLLETSQQTPDGTVFPPQVSGLPPEAQVITITAGGNDMGFLPTLISLALSKLDPNSPVLPMLEAHVRRSGVGETSALAEQAIRGLVHVVSHAKSVAPDAQVILVDYLTVLERLSGIAVKYFTPAEFEQLLMTQTTLRHVFVEAAHRSGAELIKASDLSAGHALGSPDPWVFSMGTEVDETPGWFHPNEAGMTVIAAELQRRLSS